VCWDGTGDYLTIQAGIDAASPGDEVVVCDGVYTSIGNRDIDFRGKAITVRSENGPEACIIDCEFSGRGFIFQSGETRDSVLDGFTIRNGWAVSGGAIRCYGSGPPIANMILVDNHATAGAGGAIKCSSGGGPLIVNCIIGRNYAAEAGGGIVFGGSGGWARILNCLIFGNTAAGPGGGVYAQEWNTAGPRIGNSTIVGNVAGTQGGGVGMAFYTSLLISNCIIWNNDAASGPQLAVLHVPNRPPSTLTVMYSDVEGGAAAVAVDDGQTLIWGAGNVDVNPGFVDPSQEEYRLSWGSPCIDAGDDTSVPADTADLDGDGDVAERLPVDLAGAVRFADDPSTTDTGVPDLPDYSAVVDMGAYEFVPCLGDLDGSCDITLADLAILLAHYGQWGVGPAEGDLTGDSYVGLDDLALLLTSYGDSCR